MPKYWDNAATTPVDRRVLVAMLPYFDEIFGNASSDHLYGKKAKIAIENARNLVADLINAESQEIFFTSGATESINWALKGYLESNPEEGNHIITLKTEHKAVLNTCEYLESKGFEVTYLDVNQNGLINLNELRNSIRSNTAIICVMYVNNEIGIIQDINEIGKICRQSKVTFFCDASQAVGKLPVDVVSENIDMLCISGHKFNGPKGIGALYVKKGIKLTPLIHGGGQEKGMRGGTYNTPLIVGIGEASRLAKLEFKERNNSLLEKRNEIETHFENNKIASINFKNQNRAPHIISASLIDKDADDFIIEHAHEFAISTGSACNSGMNGTSHVLESLRIAKNTIRISL